ncbi:hypothetical protein TNIN_370441 [Trichonephila inaurata madagascariensis]|uniref:Uncharacterized protein n=1 Tax=Trichonephila inaurata madagascariensis TaxID=2747483 RepID=A0A8X7CT21_9ARAC|nr:hypothetical protein TNIN_370441 [Trichonephila inaurata madagascariensis]
MKATAINSMVMEAEALVSLIKEADAIESMIKKLNVIKCIIMEVAAESMATVAWILRLCKLLLYSLGLWSHEIYCYENYSLESLNVGIAAIESITKKVVTMATMVKIIK